MATATAHKDQVAWDVLTTALEGGYAEEFEVLEHARSAEHGHVIVSAILKCHEHDVDGEDTFAVNAAMVRRGFQRYTAWVNEHDPEHNSYLASQWEEAHEEGWEYLDAIGADAVLQFACFGEIIFG